MSKHFRIALAILCSFVAASAHAANPPKVVFIGDYFTGQWTSFSTGSNWMNIANTTPGELGQDSGRSYDWSGKFAASVVSLHPDIVHIMVGAEDTAFADDGTRPLIGSLYAQAIESMVQQAKAANIKVILATTPASGPDAIGVTQINAFVQQYGAANGIPVINYANALCNCVYSTNQLGNGNAQVANVFGNAFPAPVQGHFYQMQPLMTADNTGPFPMPKITSAGYALMTQMAQNTIATMSGAQLRSGYLQDMFLFMGVGVNAFSPTANVNIVNPGNTVQFTPYGTYSDGVTRPMLNSDITGASGTWTSSNPAVMYVTPTGIAYALSAGTAWIYYRSPEGVSFSPWGMTVDSDIP
jgi:hypothetical protein